MSLKLRPLMLSLIIISAILSSSSHAAIPLKSTVCASYLLALRGDHLVPDMSESLTSHALDFVRRFRVDIIHQPLADNGNKTISAISENASPRDLQKIGRRIRGIETFLANKESDQIIAGSLYQGRENIERFLSEIEEGIPEENVNNTSTAAALTMFTALAAFGGYSTFTDATYFLHHTLSGNLGYALLTYAPKLATDLIALRPQFFAEIPMLQEFDYKSKNARIRALLQNIGTQSAWTFDSMNYRLFNSNTKEAWKVGSITSRDIRNQTLFDLSGPLAKTLVINTLKHSPDPEDIEAFTKSYIYLDRLLTKDPETGEPTLAVFLRISYKKPQTPTPPISVGVMEKIKNALKLPGTSAP